MGLLLGGRVLGFMSLPPLFQTGRVSEQNEMDSTSIRVCALKSEGNWCTVHFLLVRPLHCAMFVCLFVFLSQCVYWEPDSALFVSCVLALIWWTQSQRYITSPYLASTSIVVLSYRQGVKWFFPSLPLPSSPLASNFSEHWNNLIVAIP